MSTNPSIKRPPQLPPKSNLKTGMTPALKGPNFPFNNNNNLKKPPTPNRLNIAKSNSNSSAEQSDEDEELIRTRKEIDKIETEIEKIEWRMSIRIDSQKEKRETIENLKKAREYDDWKEKTEVESLTKQHLRERQTTVKTLIQQNISKEEELRKKKQQVEEIEAQYIIQKREQEEDQKRLEQLKMRHKVKSNIISRLLSKFLEKRPPKSELQEKNILPLEKTAPSPKLEHLVKPHIIDHELPAINTNNTDTESTSNSSIGNNFPKERIEDFIHTKNIDHELSTIFTPETQRRKKGFMKKVSETFSGIRPKPNSNEQGSPITKPSLSSKQLLSNPPDFYKSPQQRMSRIPVPQFNVSIEKLYELYQNPNNGEFEIPVVERCLEYLKFYMTSEGLFRATGSFSIVQELRDEFQKGNYSLPPKSPNEVAGLLKLFLHHLPVPLCPFEFYDEMVQIGHLIEEDERSKKLEIIMQKIPAPYYILSKKIFIFLHDFSQHSVTNKMDSKNLGLIWGPVFLRPDVTTLSSFSDVSAYHTIVESLVKEPHRFFSEDKKQNQSVAFAPLPQTEDLPSKNQNPLKKTKFSRPLSSYTPSSKQVEPTEPKEPLSFDTDRINPRLSKNHENNFESRPIPPPKEAKPVLKYSSVKIKSKMPTSLSNIRAIWEQQSNSQTNSQKNSNNNNNNQDKPKTPPRPATYRRATHTSTLPSLNKSHSRPQIPNFSSPQKDIKKSSPTLVLHNNNNNKNNNNSDNPHVPRRPSRPLPIPDSRHE